SRLDAGFCGSIGDCIPALLGNRKSYFLVSRIQVSFAQPFRNFPNIRREPAVLIENFSDLCSSTTSTRSSVGRSGVPSFIQRPTITNRMRSSFSLRLLEGAATLGLQVPDIQ